MIMRIDVTSTTGGICGTSGFLDGPLGVNMLYSPDMVAVDNEGNIFVMDSGNRYVRIISTAGMVPDFEQKLRRVYADADKRGVLCDWEEQVSVRHLDPRDHLLQVSVCETVSRDWIKTDGEPSEHIYTASSSSNSTCTTHITLCPNYTHPLIRMSKSTR